MRVSLISSFCGYKSSNGGRISKSNTMTARHFAFADRVCGPNTPFLKVKPCFFVRPCSNRDAALAIRAGAEATLLGGQHG